MGAYAQQLRSDHLARIARLYAGKPAPAPEPVPEPIAVAEPQPSNVVVLRTPVIEIIEPPEPMQVVIPTIHKIMRVVAAEYNVTMIEMQSARRTANLVMPRMIAMYLAKTMTLRSYPAIGRCFGGRDHTTVMYSVRKITDILPGCPDLMALIDRLEQRIKES